MPNGEGRRELLAEETAIQLSGINWFEPKSLTYW